MQYQLDAYMRIAITFAHNGKQLPYNYQYALARGVHHWLGEDNPWHGRPYAALSFGSLQGLRGANGGLAPVADELGWWIGSWDADFLQALFHGLLDRPEAPLGLRVTSAQIILPPKFSGRTRFFVESPIVLRQKRPDLPDRYLIYEDPDADEYLKDALLKKMAAHRVEEVDADAVNVRFDRTYPKAKTRLIQLKNDRKEIAVRGSLCPVWLEAPPLAQRFVWATGLGAGTGMGFGAVSA